MSTVINESLNDSQKTLDKIQEQVERITNNKPLHKQTLSVGGLNVLDYIKKPIVYTAILCILPIVIFTICRPKFLKDKENDQLVVSSLLLASMILGILLSVGVFFALKKWGHKLPF